MTLRSHIFGQFKQPRGPLGCLAGWIMAHRRSNRERNAWTISLLDIQPDDKILEIGCGPGIGLEICAKHLEGGQVVGLDHSRTMLNQARRRNAPQIEAGLIELYLGDLRDLDALSGPFDKIYSANVAQFFPNKTEAFRALFNVTAQKGTVGSTHWLRSRSSESWPTPPGSRVICGPSG